MNYCFDFCWKYRWYKKTHEVYRIDHSSCVHCSFPVHFALAFALRSLLRSLTAHRSPSAVIWLKYCRYGNQPFNVYISFIKFRFAFIHLLQSVRSPFKWYSRTVQELYPLTTLGTKTLYVLCYNSTML